MHCKVVRESTKECVPLRKLKDERYQHPLCPQATTSNGGGSQLGDVEWGDDRSATHTDTQDKSSSDDLTDRITGGN